MATVVLPEATRALYPFKSHYLTLSDGRRMHYIDEGPEDGEVLVFVHGYLTWSFIYRAFMIYYAAQGFRCIAMDHIGFGLSDKPTNKRYHTLRRHFANLTECITALNLHDVTLVMEDWGASFGLNYTLQHPENVKRLVIMNAWAFQDTLIRQPSRLMSVLLKPGVGELMLGTFNLAINFALQHATLRHLSPSVLTGYRAPFRDSRNRTALIQFLRMTEIGPGRPSMPLMRRIEQGMQQITSTPTLLLWGKIDPFYPVDIARHWKALMPRARGPVVLDAGHFVPEDAPELLMDHLSHFVEEETE
ncbi:MAG TPA: alpha/beta fold hydrolase [Aggregatilinea sp.]|uniref:alpha/beta fold hydrolase n=1 Tax=Aggregatilinea sp. TaxID=2806333 RepID=UPI002C022375|nr:alpha/beta fold hydrolase [Aggregatilinea sp.]HML23685.1 alpha/beta fold hydrolase [Aggregatilinea sp.]